jgi:hypothetical protein
MNHTPAVCIMPNTDMVQPNVTGIAVHNDCIPITRGGCCLPLMAVISIGNQRGITPEYIALDAGKPVITVGLFRPPLVKIWQYPSETWLNVR